MTECGKTSLVLLLVERRREVISVELEKIIYIDSENQPKFEEFQLKHPNLVIFSRDMEEIRGITSENKLNTIIILDDKMLDISGQENEEIISWFIKGSSHRNCSIIILLHSMFPPKMRTISINTKYMVMYSNPRDRLTIWNLGRQMFPGRPQFLPSAYEKAVAFPFVYLFFTSITSPTSSTVSAPQPTLNSTVEYMPYQVNTRADPQITDLIISQVRMNEISRKSYH
jgi:hypothetical protein